MIEDNNKLKEMIREIIKEELQSVMKEGFKVGTHSIYLKPTYIDMDGNQIRSLDRITFGASGTQDAMIVRGGVNSLTVTNDMHVNNQLSSNTINASYINNINNITTKNVIATEGSFNALSAESASIATDLEVTGMHQLSCSCPTYDAGTLLDVLWHYDGEDWDAMLYTLPVNTSFLRFHDTDQNNYVDFQFIYSDMNPGDPIVYVSQGFMVKKDLTVGGFLGSNQGALFLGSGLEAKSDMPQIILSHSGVSYDIKNTLEINDANGNLANMQLATINATAYKIGGLGTIYLQTTPNTMVEIDGVDGLIIGNNGALNCGNISANYFGVVNGTVTGVCASFTTYIGINSFSGSLSDLTIDVNKNWDGKGISAIGTISGHAGSFDDYLYVNQMSAEFIGVATSLDVQGDIYCDDLIVADNISGVDKLTCNSISVGTINATTYQNLPSGFSGDLSDLHIDITKNWSGKGITNLGTLNAKGGSFDSFVYTNALSAELAGIATDLEVTGNITCTTITATTYANLPSQSGNLSDLTIDNHKDWNNKSISNMATIDADVVLTSTIDADTIGCNRVNVVHVDSATVDVDVINIDSDCNLYSADTDVLATDDNFSVGGSNLNIDTTGNPVLSLIKSSDTKISVGFDGTDSFVAANKGNLLVSANYTGKYLVLYGEEQVFVASGRHLSPQNTGGSGQLGNSTRYWYDLYIHQGHIKNQYYTFDAYDDLEIVKHWGEPNASIDVISYDKSKVLPPVNDPFAILRDDDADDKNPEKNEFFNLGKVNAFNMGCLKQLARERDEQKEINKALMNSLDILTAQINSLSVIIAKFS